MPAATDNFHEERYQKAVYWASSGSNNFGENTVDAPVEMDVRIEEGLKDILDENGNRVATKMQMNVDRDIVIGSLVWVGQKKNLPTPIPELLQVVEFEKIPDASADTFDRNIKLVRYGDGDPVLTSSL